MKAISLILTGLLMTGCVTKQQLLPTDAEKAASYRPAQSCSEINYYISVNKDRIERLENESAHSFWSFMLDFNAGNGAAKFNGLKEARLRLADLEAAKAERCTKQATR